MARMLGIVACAATIALTAVTPAAAGPPIRKLAVCPDQDMRYTGPEDAARFRTAVGCLMTAIRKAERLPGLRRDAKLERAAQGHATSQGRSGALSHGASVREIPRRIARAGYRASAVNEGLGIGAGAESAYEIVSRMMEQQACTQILDPRFRDAGVGVSLGKLRGSPGSSYVHLVVNFGLRSGAKPASSRRTPAATCPHRLPTPGTAVPQGEGPVAQESTVTVQLKCTGSAPCSGDASIELVTSRASATASYAIERGQTRTVTFTVDAAAIQQELASPSPRARLTAGGRTYDAPLRRG